MAGAGVVVAGREIEGGAMKVFGRQLSMKKPMVAGTGPSEEWVGAWGPSETDRLDRKSVV